MSRSQLLALLFGLLLVAAPFASRADEYDDGLDEGEAEEPAEEGGVPDPDTVVVTEANFNDVVGKAQFALVEFYAPWTLAPEYAKAATALKNYEPKVVIAKVDATKHNALGQKYEVQGFPTIKWFVDGELVSDYDSGRDAESIIRWVKKKTGPAAVTVDSPEALAALEKESAVVAVGYFAAFEGAAYDAFKTTAIKTDGVVFAQTTDAKVAAEAGLTAHGIAAVKNHVGEARATTLFEDDVSEDALKTFFLGERLPLTIEFTQENAQRIFNSGIYQQIITYSAAADFESDAALASNLRAVASQFKGKLIFVTSSSESPSSEPIANYFGLKGAKTPVVLGFNQQGNKKFRFSGDATSKAELSAFAQSLLDGTAPADFKGAPIPSEPKDEGVTVIVRDNFDSIVLDPKKDVFLEVYAPWCGHCKSLAPIWSKLAHKLASIDSVVIAKMDGTENEHAKVDVQGFPTLLFFPAGEDKQPIVYSGGRDLQELALYVKDNAKTPFEIPAGGDGEEDDEDDEDEEQSAAEEGGAGKDEL